jgi:hypothetical protein
LWEKLDEGTDHTVANGFTIDMKSIEDDGNIPLTLYTQQVICAWPVSGLYGPGTRILYVALPPSAKNLGTLAGGGASR